MRYIKILFSVAFMLCLLGCKSSAMNKAERETQLEALKQLLESRNFRIDVDAVLPFNTAASQRVLNSLLRNRMGDNAGRINIQGQGFYVSHNDSLTNADLPFYGEQRIAGGHYGQSDTGIKFSSEPRNFRLEKHKRQDAYILKYSVDGSVNLQESFDVVIKVFPSKNTNISIMSSHRMLINYIGTLEAVE